MQRITLLMLLTVLLSPLTGVAQSSEVLQVKGLAIVEETPENFMLRIAIETTDPLYENCSKDLFAKIELVQSELLTAGLKKDQVRALDVSIAEQYNYVNGKREKAGYKGTARLEVTDAYHPEKLGTLIRVPEKHQSAFNLSFVLSDPQKDKLTEKAIMEAVEDAKSKAAMIAKASGVRLVKIDRINYESSEVGVYPLARSVESNAAMMDRGDELDLSPKPISIRKSIEMTWQISN